jgi:zinc protease
MIQRDPNRQISNSVDSVVGNITQRRAMLPADLKALNLDSMDLYYRRLYTNPQGLTFILTGHYDLPTVERAAIGTFARMQAPDSVLTVNDEPVQPLRSFERQFPHSNPTQTVFNHLFAGNYYPSLRATLTFKLMRDLLQQRMLSVLRERENIVYSPYCDLAYHGLPQRTYYFWLCFAVKNENTERAQEALREIVDGLQTKPVDAVELEKLKRSFCVTKRRQLSDVAPSEWKDCLSNLLKNGEELEDFDHYDEVLGSITPADVQKAFRDYIDFDNHIIMYQKQ